MDSNYSVQTALQAFDLVVLSTPRSGSTLLCHDILRFSHYSHIDEYLLYFIDNRYTGCPHSLVAEKIILDSGEGPKGIKIMSSQLAVLEKITPNRSDHGSPDQTISQFLDPKTVLFIYRENLLKQAISLEIAKLTSIAHVIKSDNEDIVPGSACSDAVDYQNQIDQAFHDADIDNIFLLALDLYRENITLSAIVSKCKVNTIISYEEYVRNPIHLLRKTGIAKEIELTNETINHSRGLVPTQKPRNYDLKYKELVKLSRGELGNHCLEYFNPKPIIYMMKDYSPNMAESIINAYIEELRKMPDTYIF
jgi:LPS sulfotransferase NodH